MKVFSEIPVLSGNYKRKDFSSLGRLHSENLRY